MTETVDAIGLLCPLPVLKLRKRMKPLASGVQITLLSDDPAALVDVPHFCTESGHKLVGTTEAADHIAFTVEKA